MSTSSVICGDLASTGQPLNALVVTGLCCLLAGLMLLLLARAPRGRTVVATALMMMVLVAVPVAVDGGSSMAQAGGPDCVTPEPAGPDPAESPLAIGPLAIEQISTMTGLAPGAGPEPVAGRITNNGPVDLYVTDVTVSIVSVIKAPDAAAGACDASDYLLQAVRMPVGVTIPPGGSTLFSGASIKFMNKQSTNQDACQGAAIGLRYVST